MALAIEIFMINLKDRSIKHAFTFLGGADMKNFF